MHGPNCSGAYAIRIETPGITCGPQRLCQGPLGATGAPLLQSTPNLAQTLFGGSAMKTSHTKIVTKLHTWGTILLQQLRFKWKLGDHFTDQHNTGLELKAAQRPERIVY